MLTTFTLSGLGLRVWEHDANNKTENNVIHWKKTKCMNYETMSMILELHRSSFTSVAFKMKLIIMQGNWNTFLVMFDFKECWSIRVKTCLKGETTERSNNNNNNNVTYIYHALINALSAHMIHINLNMIFYTHVERSPTKTIYIKYFKISHVTFSVSGKVEVLTFLFYKCK